MVMKRASVLPVANKSFFNLDHFQHLSKSSPIIFFKKAPESSKYAVATQCFG